MAGGHPVIFVGLDGADWEFLDPLIARGAMPNLAQLVSEGRSGVLRTQHPPLSPLVWTSMMTGKSPLEHRILDFTRFNPATGAREPITSDERAVPAIWNMVAAAGQSAAVLGLWATYPAEPIGSLVVSDRAVQFGSREPGAVAPADRAAAVESARAAAEASADLPSLRALLPDLTAEELARAAAKSASEAYGEPVSALRRIVIETRTVQSLALTAAADDPRLLVAYFEGTDTIGHVFAPFAPPRQASVREADCARYGQVAERYFAEIDRDLGALRELARAQGAVLMVASDHGFRWGADRPRELSSLAAASAARWHRDQGIYVLWGTDIDPAARAAVGGGGEAGVRQVCATLLALLGLPPASGIAGPALEGAPAVTAAPRDYAADFHRAAAASPGSGGDAQEALARLRALGYVGGAEASGRLPGSTRTPASFNNEGLLLREQGSVQPAAAAFQQALALDPRYASAAFNLSDLLEAEGRDHERSDALLLQAIENGMPEGDERLVARAVARRASGGAVVSVALLDQALARLPETGPLRLYRGRYRLELQDCAGAQSDFARAVALEADNPIAQASLGTAAMCLGDAAAARRAFAASLRLDPNQPQLRQWMERNPR